MYYYTLYSIFKNTYQNNLLYLKKRWYNILLSYEYFLLQTFSTYSKSKAFTGSGLHQGSVNMGGLPILLARTARLFFTRYSERTV